MTPAEGAAAAQDSTPYVPFCAGPVLATVVVLKRRSVRGQPREVAESVVWSEVLPNNDNEHRITDAGRPIITVWPDCGGFGRLDGAGMLRRRPGRTWTSWLGC